MNRCLAWLCWLLVAVAVTSSVPGADRIVPSARLPENLPWDLAKLSEPPPFEWLDEESPVRSLLFEGEFYHGRPTRVFAYYATPERAEEPSSVVSGKFPAVVLVHGGGGTAFREWVELWAGRGYAAIAMDLAGYRPLEGKNQHARENRERLADGGPDQGDEEKFLRIDQPLEQQWQYHAVANVLRAHSLVRSFPEVDTSRTAVTGISWGGYLTCIVAGVDSRFRAAVPVYGCGYLYENSAWLDRLAGLSPEQRQRWVDWWDPSRYLPAVSMPILFVNGTNDFAYPLDSYMKSFDAVPGSKQIRVTVNMPHGHPQGWAPEEIGWFVDHHLRGEPGLPTLETPVIEAGRVRVTVESPLPIGRAELHFTTETGPINQRTWQSRDAGIDGSTITTDAPPDDATAWFVTATDQRGAVASSRVLFPR